MRKLFIADPEGDFRRQEARALELGCAEVALGPPPRYEGLVTSLPAIVVESRSRPGEILAIFNEVQFSRELLDALEDVPPPEPTVGLPESVLTIVRRIEVFEKDLSKLTERLDVDPDQKVQWQGAKGQGASAMLTFLARRLGLE